MFDLELRRLASNESPTDSIDYNPKLTTRSQFNTSRNVPKTFRTSRSESGIHIIDHTFDFFSNNSRRTSLTKFTESESEYGTSESCYTSISKLKLPKVVVRNPMGHALRTESSFQRAIAEARVRIREEG